jgi:caffeoyl-CoA O-methyltransferase
MSRHFSFDERTYDYLLKTSVRQTDVALRLREETQKLPQAQMQIGPDQGQFLQLLVQLMQATKTLEVGVFTGYSSLWVAMGLPEDGRIVACDVSEEFTSIARRYWKEAGLDHKIDLQLRPALKLLMNCWRMEMQRRSTSRSSMPTRQTTTTTTNVRLNLSGAAG